MELEEKYTLNPTSAGIKETSTQLASGTWYQLQNWVSLTLLLEVTRPRKAEQQAGRAPLRRAGELEAAGRLPAEARGRVFDVLNLGVKAIKERLCFLHKQELQTVWD